MKKDLSILIALSFSTLLLANSASALTYSEELPPTSTTSSVETVTNTTTDTSTSTSTETTTTSATTTTTPQPAFQDFKDVPLTHPYYNAIVVLRYQKVLNGYPDNTFHPDQPLNRVEALKLIFEVAAIQLTNGIAPVKFSDTEETAWYSGYLSKATFLEVVAGYPDGTFKPSQSVNLVEFLKMLLIAQKADLTNVNLSQIPYSDVMPGQWYSKYINYSKIHELLKADDKNQVFPDQPLTRGRAADIIYRFKNMLSQPVAGTDDTATDTSGSPAPAPITDFAQYVSSSYLFAIQYPKVWFYSAMDNLDPTAIRTYGFGPKDLETNPPLVTLELLPADSNFQANLVYNGFSYFQADAANDQVKLSAKINGSTRIYRLSGAKDQLTTMLKMISSLTTDIESLATPDTSTTTTTTP